MATDTLSATFAALADPTRRSMLAQLAKGPATVTELARPHAMSLPSVSRHLKVLEHAGLVAKGREAQWRPCRLQAAPLQDVDAWMSTYREFFEASFDRLEQHLQTMREPMSTTTDRGFTIVRRLSAAREVVFQAWTDPEHLGWFANPTFPPVHPTTVDLRVGGEWRLHMVESEAKAYMTGGVYREILPPERLVFSWGAVDGWPTIDPAPPDDVPLVTITLNEVDGGTEMVFRVELAGHLTDDEVREWLATGMAQGWAATLDRLEPQLAGAAHSLDSSTHRS